VAGSTWCATKLQPSLHNCCSKIYYGTPCVSLQISRNWGSYIKLAQAPKNRFLVRPFLVLSVVC
jgi:hypothetical protein